MGVRTVGVAGAADATGALAGAATWAHADVSTSDRTTANANRVYKLNLFINETSCYIYYFVVRQLMIKIVGLEFIILYI
jgi:hypothetical protein